MDHESRKNCGITGQELLSIPIVVLKTARGLDKPARVLPIRAPASSVPVSPASNSSNLHTGIRQCRESCEILGSKNCPCCQEAGLRSRLGVRNAHQTNPDLISTSTARAARLEQLLPTLTPVEIQKKLTCGQIAPAASVRTFDKHSKPSVELKRMPEITAPSSRFYSDLDDLRRKIYLGLIPPSRKASSKLSATEKLFPPFVSPKRVQPASSKTPLTHIAPPLLALASQNPPHAFFAGQKGYFKMLTPLPQNPRHLSALSSPRTSTATSQGDSAIQRKSTGSSLSSSLSANRLGCTQTNLMTQM